VNAPAPNCDCAVKNVGIAAGTNSRSWFRQKTTCNKSNYSSIKDSLSSAENVVYNDDLDEELDTLSLKYMQSKKYLDSMSHEWVVCKLKLKYQRINHDTICEIITKRKITYYKLGIWGLRKMKKEVLITHFIEKKI
jgi:hypothetical protein